MEKKLTTKPFENLRLKLDAEKLNLEEFKKINKKITEEFKASFGPFQEFSKILFQALIKTKDLHPWFIHHDWYLSIRWWNEYMLSRPFFEKNSEIEREIVMRFDKEINITKRELIHHHSERKLVLQEIFKLYKQKYYYSVVALSYSLTDGICNKKFGIPFWGGFKNEDNKTNNQRIIEQLNDAHTIRFDHIRLNHRGEMNLNDKKISIDKISKSNNRHLVLHGLSYEYGTKINAVKSILLLEFINSLNSKQSKK